MKLNNTILKPNLSGITSSAGRNPIRTRNVFRLYSVDRSTQPTCPLLLAAHKDLLTKESGTLDHKDLLAKQSRSLDQKRMRRGGGGRSVEEPS